MRRFRIMNREELKWLIIGMLIVIAILAYGDYQARRLSAPPSPTPPSFIQKLNDEIKDTPTLSPRIIEIIQQDSGKVLINKPGLIVTVPTDDQTSQIIEDKDAPKTFASDN